MDHFHPPNRGKDHTSAQRRRSSPETRSESLEISPELRNSIDLDFLFYDIFRAFKEQGHD
jgi:hypothetical protein